MYLIRIDTVFHSENTLLSTRMMQVNKIRTGEEFSKWTCCEKTCLRGFANNIGADQPAHSRSLISAFVIRFMESIIRKLASSEL